MRPQPPPVTHAGKLVSAHARTRAHIHAHAHTHTPPATLAPLSRDTGQLCCVPGKTELRPAHRARAEGGLGLPLHTFASAAPLRKAPTPPAACSRTPPACKGQLRHRPPPLPRTLQLCIWPLLNSSSFGLERAIHSTKVQEEYLLTPDTVLGAGTWGLRPRPLRVDVLVGICSPLGRLPAPGGQRGHLIHPS